MSGGDYVPSTEEVRNVWAAMSHPIDPGDTGVGRSEFDRWLASHDVEVLHEAADSLQEQVCAGYYNPDNCRDDFSCRRCGVTPGSQIHHRAARGRWGIKGADWVNGMAALVLLCVPCHTHIESRRTEGYATGFLVRRNSQDLPEEIPMTDLHGRMFVLDDLGGVTYITKEAS